MVINKEKIMRRLDDFIKVRENKLLDLYEIITGSDFKGKIIDTYVVELLFAILAIDMANDNEQLYNRHEIYILAENVIRLFECEDEMPSVYSIHNWANAMFQYMKINKLDYKKIHRMNIIDLRREVSEYIEKEAF